MTTIADKNVLITGAARGMGKRMAERFGEKGGRIFAVDLDGDKLEETAEELRSRNINVDTYVCDLSEKENIDSLRDEVHEDVDSIDILVNNAGVVQGGNYEEIDDDADELTLNVNVDAVHWMTKKFLQDLTDNGGGHLVQMASAAGLIGVPKQNVYSASKWFVVGLSRALRQELLARGHDDIGITIVCPSLVDTGMFEGSEAPLLMPYLEPEFMAEEIIKGVENDKLFIREPFMVKLIPLLKGILPNAAVDFVLDMTGARDIMNKWKGR